MTTDYYYVNADEFGCDVMEGLMPTDVKRIYKHCDHTYEKRFYFVSASEKMIYRYFPDYEMSETLMSSNYGKGQKFNILTDAGKHDSIVINSRFLKRIENMKSLILPRMK